MVARVPRAEQLVSAARAPHPQVEQVVPDEGEGEGEW